MFFSRGFFVDEFLTHCTTYVRGEPKGTGRKKEKEIKVILSNDGNVIPYLVQSYI